MTRPLLAAALLLAATRPAAGQGPAVLANRTGSDVSAAAPSAGGPPHRFTVPRHDLTVLTLAGPTSVSFVSGGQSRATTVEPGTAYAFTGSAADLRLEPLFVSRTPAPAGAAGVLAMPPVVILPVKLLVDDAEPANRGVWEPRLRRRVAAASDVLERHCRVRLEVVAVGTWQSSPLGGGFDAQFADFERKVPPRPARLALGFSGRPWPKQPSTATSVPLCPHVLIGEWFPMAEFQREEVLLHELGHYFGAVHSPEAETVMRLSHGDARSMRRDFRIGFDPLNTLAMNLVARELAGPRPPRKLGALSPATRGRLRALYTAAAGLLPKDPGPEQYLRFLDDVPPPRPARSPDPLVDGARAVAAAVVAAAEDAAERQLEGDRATERCVRSAAAAAERLPEAQRVPAFLLGLAVALDTSDLLRKAATTRGLWGRVEYDDEREERLKAVGQPTLHGRPGLARHFAVAAAMTAIAGGRAAEPGGIVRELFDAESGGTVGFDDLAAELSGAAFAKALAEEPGRLASVAASFRGVDYVAAPEGLDEGLAREEFARRYGPATDERYRRREAEVRRRVAALPAYRPK